MYLTFTGLWLYTGMRSSFLCVEFVSAEYQFSSADSEMLLGKGNRMPVFDRNVLSWLSDAVSAGKPNNPSRLSYRLFAFVVSVSPILLCDFASAQIPNRPDGTETYAVQPGVLSLERPPAPGDKVNRNPFISRIRVDIPEGVFLVYDAAIPPSTDSPSRGERRAAGFLAYWSDNGTGQFYVFERVLYLRTDLG